MAVSRLILVVAVIVFGAATASAEPVRKNANGCTVIAPPAPKVSPVAGTAPSASVVLELYVSVGQHLKRVRELRGQDSTDDLMMRFRLIQIQRAIQSDASRQLAANELLALQHMIAKRLQV